MRSRIAAVLGEENLELTLVGEEVLTGRFRGYRVKRQGEQVVIKGLQPPSSPLFYFKGHVHSAPNGRRQLKGRMKMKLLPKIFIFTWSAIVLTALVFGSLYALYGAFRFLLVPSRENEIALEGAGIMVAVATVCVLFGVTLFSLMLWFGRGQRRRLKEYCKAVAMSPTKARGMTD